MDSLLELKNITKVYPGVVANRDISFNLQEGEIHAICGENGAGKSTLMKIIFGMEIPSEGKIYLRGEHVHIRSPHDAISMGIGMVHQHFMLVPSFTVAENLVLGIEPSKRTKINHREAVEKTIEIAKRFNLVVTPEAKVRDISVGMMQKLEILKALYRGAKILILDEPTAVLTPQETEELFDELLLLRQKGHTIVFISHKLQEVKKISDRITVIRRGEVTGQFDTKDVSEEEISACMIGKLVMKRENNETPEYGKVVLDTSNLCQITPSEKKVLSNISLSIREGEILGVAGVEGNGQSELIRILTGQDSPASGTFSVMGNNVIITGIRNIRSQGVAYIPENRMKDGCAVGATVWENLISNRIDSPEFSSGSILRKQKITSYSEQLVGEYSILCAGIDNKAAQLSGGNIQKIVVARECSDNPNLLIADQPTRGVDVGAANMIHEKIVDLSRQGTAVLMVSADLTELLEVCTSLIVLYEGEITASFRDIRELNENELGYYMLGIKRQESVNG